MDGSFIPPPFPFPEAWPRVFAEQQQRQSGQWLTPSTFAQWQAAASAANYQSVDQSITAEIANHNDAEEDGSDGGDGEYEYGYVLSDEWRERFQSSVQVQQQQQQQQKRNSGSKKRKQKPKPKSRQQRQALSAEALAAASAARSGHLQREIQAARTRELARKWKRRAGVDASPSAAATAQIHALETHLNMRFDEYCDAFQPVVWPHDPVQ
ncbi:uncharacterized protein IUM83_10861 [Phytophthora cinnamomi]|uniref:uncharacterized protein n=1 Tax=Phytophthora cinnamomi TaxID=4785 RepID=UPI00355A5E53|nr:hypothetical protein IUM83_10861 [Phytophthora cinnamomi]